MPEFITLGETMAVMVPKDIGSLRYSPDFRLRMAGAESNTAIGLSKLGHSAGWISALGMDGLGEYVLASIRSEGVDVSRVKQDISHRTGLMIKELSRGETTVYYYRENSAASHFTEAEIPYDYLSSATCLHLTGITPVLSETCLKTTEAIIDFANKNNKLLSFDPNIRRKLWGENDYCEMIRKMMFSSQIALLGLDEATTLLHTDKPMEIVRILREKGVKYIAIKNGGQGAWCADENHFAEIAPEACNCVDPIGAGDGFNAGFLCGLLEKRDIAACGRMGAIAGAMATETNGDIEGYPSRRQMDNRLIKSELIYR